MRLKRWCALVLAGLCGGAAAQGPVVLTADPHTPPYVRIEEALGATPETPDCADPKRSPHIVQALDPDVKRYVFVFELHVTPDNDRCERFDRQRTEMKTDMHSPEYLKGRLNESVTFRWRFKLPTGFRPSDDFTHIHQIKAADGDDDAPIITLTARRGNPNTLELLHVDSSGATHMLGTTLLDPFINSWAEAYEKLTYGPHGSYSIVIRRVADGKQLLSYATGNIDLWRKGTTVARPKWGLYRSLKRRDQLRDEYIELDHICLAKGSDDCPVEQAGAAAP